MPPGQRSEVVGAWRYGVSATTHAVNFKPWSSPQHAIPYAWNIGSTMRLTVNLSLCLPSEIDTASEAEIQSGTA